MATSIEIEAKVLVSADDFYKVRQAMEADKHTMIKQTNHYIDTDLQGVLRRYGVAARVREIDDEFALTIKVPLAEAILEKTQSLSRKEFYDLAEKEIFPEGHIANFLDSLGCPLGKLKILTSMTTYRTSLNYKDYKFSMDKNHYSDTVDYELEMEGSSLGKAEDLLQEVCEFAGVPFVLNQRSKQARAMSMIKEK
ncbi:MAG: CYTH domain-containing protein [Erysipelotrichaceae bacterium]|nr:CYTH domain-containing protein [Erysipelotrichaceae bacterium]